jgi:hypothetical protein
MADITQQKYPLTIGGKKVEGVLTTYPDGGAKWSYKDDALARPTGGYGPLVGDYSTFTVKKVAGNKWVWSQTTDTSIDNLAKRTGLTSKQVTDTLNKNPTLQNGLNQQRLAQLGGPAAAAKIDPTITGATNVAPAAGGAAGTGEEAKPTVDQITEQKFREGVEIGSFREDYGALGSLRYPENMKEDQDCIRFEMIRYIPKKFNTDVKSTGPMFTEDDSYLKSTDKKLLGNVILPIQSPISDSNTVSWGEDSMQSLQALAAGAAMGLITSGQGGISLNEVANNLQNSTPALKALIASAAADKAVSGTNSNLFTRLTGAILNPNMELLFTGPQLRSFSFSFVMSARDDKEAKIIRSIIRFFKQGMSVKRGKTNLFLLTPNVFQISYLYRGTNKHPWMNRIKTCALQNCSVNYTPSGNYATYEDGSMTSYEMTLSFGELTPIYDDDYNFEGNINAPIAHIGY